MEGADSGASDMVLTNTHGRGGLRVREWNVDRTEFFFSLLLWGEMPKKGAGESHCGPAASPSFLSSVTPANLVVTIEQTAPNLHWLAHFFGLR